MLTVKLTVHLTQRNRQHGHPKIRTCQKWIVRKFVYVNVKNLIRNRSFDGFEVTDHALLLYHTFCIVQVIMTDVKAMKECKDIDCLSMTVKVSFQWIFKYLC